MNAKYICPRCGNSDERFIGYLNGLPYCRRCLCYAGRKIEKRSEVSPGISLQINYHLSKEQERIANEVKENFIKGKDALIQAVTGAGKTELVYYTMEYALARRLKVGFSAPRRDVVIDLCPRIASAFPQAETIMVIGDHTSKLNGDITCLTAQQLYRYPSYFDLLIIDEIDAYPYQNDPVLKAFARKALKGHLILLSATPSEEDIREIRKSGTVFSMLARYHHHALPLPEFKKAEISPLIKGIIELRRLLKKKKQVFFFVPTIEMGRRYYPLIALFCPKGALVHSQEEKRDELIKKFKSGNLSYLVTTSILERGVTVKGLQVIVCQADHELYSAPALIQIAGRAGRKKEEPDGEVIFIGRRENEAIETAIQTIADTNQKARVQGLL